MKTILTFTAIVMLTGACAAQVNAPTNNNGNVNNYNNYPTDSGYTNYPTNNNNSNNNYSNYPSNNNNSNYPTNNNYNNYSTDSGYTLTPTNNNNSNNNYSNYPSNNGNPNNPPQNNYYQNDNNNNYPSNNNNPNNPPQNNYSQDNGYGNNGQSNNYSQGNSYGNNYQNNAPPPQQVNYNNPSYQTYYDALAPYGNWVTYGQYSYVWVPSAGPDFRPYSTNGYWTYTNYGWTWQSNYPWGWAPFHYGNWLFDAYYGWLWVPGNQWAPAWVTWGTYNNSYYGWAPIPPGAALAYGYNPPAQYWAYVPYRNMGDPYMANYVVANNSFDRNNVVIVNNYNTYNSAYYSTGPRREEVETVSGRSINTVQVVDVGRPGTNSAQGNQVAIYRPDMSHANNVQAVPARVTPVQNLKERNSTEAPVRSINTPQVKTDNTAVPRQEVPIQKPAGVQNYQPPQHAAAPEQKPTTNQPQKSQPQAQPQQHPAPEQKPAVNPQPEQQHPAQPQQQSKQPQQANPQRQGQGQNPQNKGQKKPKQQQNKPAKQPANNPPPQERK